MSDPGSPAADPAPTMRVRGAQQALVLRARAAARALGRPSFGVVSARWLGRRALPVRTAAWRPLLLRWGRRAAALQGSGTRTAASGTAPGARFDWHFHFSTVAAAERERGPAGAAGPATTSMHAAGAGAQARTAPPAPGTRPAAYAALPIKRGIQHTRWLAGTQPVRYAPAPRAAPAQPTPGGHVAPAAPPAAMASGLPPAAPAAMMPAPAAVEARPGAVRTDFVPRTRTQFTRMELRLRRTGMQVTRTAPWPQRGQAAGRASGSPRPPDAGRRPGQQAWRTRTAPAAALAYPARTVAAHALPGTAPGRPVDLVWLAAPAGAAAPGALPGFGSAPDASPASPASAAAAPPAAVQRSGQETVVRATALDPALATRLADEVIRRIDYRARIERERRGL